jgi:hypothetical protein
MRLIDFDDGFGTETIPAESTAIADSVAEAAASASDAADSAADAAASAVAAASYVTITETAFTIVNNQAAPANVTGLAVSGATYRSFVVEYFIYRNTTGGGATELAESGVLVGVFKTVASTWEMQQAPVVGDSGVDLTITAAGQVQYVSSNITGTPASSLMKFKATTLGV